MLRLGTPLQRGDVASFAFSLHANAPGSLLEALTCVARLGFNMSRIESRPSKRELGEYVFFVDVELRDGGIGASEQLIEALQPLCEHLVHFGSYLSSDLELD